MMDATTTLKRTVGAQAFYGNPYDGHTLAEQLKQASILMQDSTVRPTTAFVDLGYRDVNADNPQIVITHRSTNKLISEHERKLLKGRQAIKPIIGHLKSVHRMDRRHLKGKTGDRLHAVLCAAGYNIRWLPHQIARKGLTFLQAVLLCLQQGPAHRGGLGWQPEGCATLGCRCPINPAKNLCRPAKLSRWLVLSCLK